MRRKVGTDEIPALLLEDGTAITGDADEIVAWLTEQLLQSAPTRAEHRRQAEERRARR